MPSGFAQAAQHQYGSIGATFQQQAAASEQPREQEAQQAQPEVVQSRRQGPHSGQTFYEQDEHSQEITASRENRGEVRIVNAREGRTARPLIESQPGLRTVRNSYRIRDSRIKETQAALTTRGRKLLTPMRALASTGTVLINQHADHGHSRVVVRANSLDGIQQVSKARR